MANIANLITKLTGIIASLDDIRDAISQGGGGSSTASGVSVTPTSPLTGTNLQATTNETAALLQDHADEISTLNSSMIKIGTVAITNLDVNQAFGNIYSGQLTIDLTSLGITNSQIVGVTFKQSTAVTAWCAMGQAPGDPNRALVYFYRGSTGVVSGTLTFLYV